MRYLQSLRKNKWYAGIVLLGFLIPFTYTLALVIHYAVNVPFGDDWSMAPIFRHIDQGTLSFGDL